MRLSRNIDSSIKNCAPQDYTIVHNVPTVSTYCATSCFTLFWKFLQSSYFIPSALSLGLFWHQLVFAAHDAGHMGITHSFHMDSCIGILLANFLGWWKCNHNIHHIMTNSPEHDPEIAHLPFFAISHRFFSSLYSSYHDRAMEFDTTCRFFVKYQTYLYYPILLLGRFNLYVLAWTYLRNPSRHPAKDPHGGTATSKSSGSSFSGTGTNHLQ
ncbi:hypothetical protein EAF00_009930 [Botryotinia globosa]|nr:hypothetical protein EAF00_009930 [Botryotinia globosa]